MQNRDMIYELFVYYKRYNITFKITSEGQCAIHCIENNTVTEEQFSDDLCSGYEYNADTKECVLGKLDTSRESTPNTKPVMLKFYPPWLVPVTTSNIIITSMPINNIYE